MAAHSDVVVSRVNIAVFTFYLDGIENPHPGGFTSSYLGMQAAVKERESE